MERPYVEGVAWLVSDGGSVGRNPSAIGGTWCYACMDENNQRILHECGVITPSHVKLPVVTNNVAEMVAAVNALKRVPSGWNGRILSDSKVTLYRLFWGWRMEGIPPWLLEEIRTLHDRLDMRRIRPVLVQGHPTKAELQNKRGRSGLPVSHQNVWCDEQCSGLARAVLAARVPHEEAERLLQEYLLGLGGGNEVG